MNLFLSSQNNLDEVVFENRNKQYGAYALRKSYDETLIKATLSSLGLLFLVGSSLYGISLLKPEIKPLVSDIVRATDEHTLINDLVIILDPAPPPQGSALNTDNMRYNIVRDRLVTEPLITPPNPTLPFNPTGTTTPGTGGVETGTLTGSMPTAVVLPVVEPPIPTFVNEMPTFDGGTDAMVRFLKNEMIYPSQARELGIEGKVMVEFVVQTDGSISQIKILKGFGFGSEEEATRVVQNMPKWIPGSQNGKRLAVRLVLPLQFTLDH